MEDKLMQMAERFAQIEKELADPSVTGDMNRFRKLNKEHSQLSPVVAKYEEYRRMRSDLHDSEELLKTETDSDMRDMLSEEKNSLKDKITAAEEELTIMLLPKDPNSGKDIIMEIRAGTGGDEAALFAADLFRMYTRYADVRKWKTELLEKSDTGIGGFKEIVFSISGDAAYDELKYESGTHRVQRIPVTEAGGRIHTSAVTVAVMPEAEEDEVQINPDDIETDVFRSSGAGGQHVNTTDSAVRLTHKPTGIVVSCQDERSQIKNRAKALRILRTKIFEMQETKRRQEEAQLRKAQVGSGDRSERIRTYNFPQSRVTDHRIGLTLYSLDAVLNGDLIGLIEPLKKNEVEELLKSQYTGI
ncbi:MAG TPA: peptide chain release factor 1 [Spirochaetota bacterium]|nr:peptide chain release factor 1 [Spirochaetota bacterium]